MINELSQLIHENARTKGFYDSERNIGEMLCLIHSEVSEALEADRKGRYSDMPLFNRMMHIEESDFNESFVRSIKDTFEDELADAMIRIMDLAAFKEIDLEKHIQLKMKYNSFRPHKHGKSY